MGTMAMGIRPLARLISCKKGLFFAFSGSECLTLDAPAGDFQVDKFSGKVADRIGDTLAASSDSDTEDSPWLLPEKVQS